jgi:hypothetical protein
VDRLRTALDGQVSVRPAGIQAAYDPRDISRDNQNFLPETVKSAMFRTAANIAGITHPATG